MPTALRHVIKPERVMCYSRRTTVAWAALDPRLQVHSHAPASRMPGLVVIPWWLDSCYVNSLPWLTNMRGIGWQ
jgi:hypothetical protein